MSWVQKKMEEDAAAAKLAKAAGGKTFQAGIRADNSSSQGGVPVPGGPRLSHVARTPSQRPMEDPLNPL
jgi:hypothetical protein